MYYAYLIHIIPYIMCLTKFYLVRISAYWVHSKETP